MKLKYKNFFFLIVFEIADIVYDKLLNAFGFYTI